MQYTIYSVITRSLCRARFDPPFDSIFRTSLSGDIDMRVIFCKLWRIWLFQPLRPNVQEENLLVVSAQLHKRSNPHVAIVLMSKPARHKIYLIRLEGQYYWGGLTVVTGHRLLHKWTNRYSNMKLTVLSKSHVPANRKKKNWPPSIRQFVNTTHGNKREKKSCTSIFDQYAS